VGDPVALVTVTLFALVNGVNDGGTIVGVGSRTLVSRPWVPLLAIVLALGAAPMVVGTRVADTLANSLVQFEGAGGRASLVAAVIATLLVVWILTTRGLPTSLTLGLVGAIAGSGLAAGQPVAWGALGIVLAIGALAPILGIGGAFALHRLLNPVAGRSLPLRRCLPGLGYGLQCVAYGANDGQKMLAVLFVTVGIPLGVTELTEAVPLALWVATVAIFGLGTLVGMARVGRTLAGGVLPVRTELTSVAQLSASGAVIGSAALGAPVSLTQAVTGGLVGAGASVTPRRVRWQAAGRIAVAWAITLPASFLVGATISWSVTVAR
jgi:inorganic phosphate transporter, PiT family